MLVEWDSDADMLTSKTPASQDAPGVAPDPNDWKYWATLITSTWQSSVLNIIETGRLLVKAKDQIAPGEFGDMIKKFLPFKQRTAQKLMKLARNKVLANAAHVPPGWTGRMLLRSSRSRLMPFRASRPWRSSSKSMLNKLA